VVDIAKHGNATSKKPTIDGARARAACVGQNWAATVPELAVATLAAGSSPPYGRRRLIVDIPESAVGSQSSALERMGWRTNELEFEDAVGRWQNDVAGLRLLRRGVWLRGADASGLGHETTTIAIPADAGPSVSAPVTMEPLDDCGVDI
jgi:hypothetical protein